MQAGFSQLTRSLAIAKKLFSAPLPVCVWGGGDLDPHLVRVSVESVDLDLDQDSSLDADPNSNQDSDVDSQPDEGLDTDLDGAWRCLR